MKPRLKLIVSDSNTDVLGADVLGKSSAHYQGAGLTRAQNHLSEQVRSYLRHAEQCGQRAKIEPDPNLAREYLDMEQRWLKLARRYQFSESLEAFSKQNKKRQDEAIDRAMMIARREPSKRSSKKGKTRLGIRVV
jgi:hypothetical protein